MEIEVLFGTVIRRNAFDGFSRFQRDSQRLGANIKRNSLDRWVVDGVQNKLFLEDFQAMACWQMAWNGTPPAFVVSAT